jgi:hypothetical protein
MLSKLNITAAASIQHFDVNTTDFSVFVYSNLDITQGNFPIRFPNDDRTESRFIWCFITPSCKGLEISVSRA